MLVEPRTGVLTALALVLRASCSVEAAATLAEALARAAEWAPDAVVVDVSSTAVEELRLVRTLAERRRRTRLVVVTDDVVAALPELAGVALDGLLQKPVLGEHLFRRIRSALGLPAVRISRDTLSVIEYVADHFTGRCTPGGTGPPGGVSPTHRALRFRNETKLTLKRYVTAMRIEAAKRLLVTTDAKLVSVARQSGFYDDSHLCRVFLATVGIRPGDYRARMQTRFSWQLSNADDRLSSYCA
jgi:AraC-like DNA-binding protein